MGGAGATDGTGARDRAGTGAASGAGDESWAGTLAGEGGRTEGETRAGVGLTGAGAGGEVRVGAKKKGLCRDPNNGIGAGMAGTGTGGKSHVSLPTESKGVREPDV